MKKMKMKFDWWNREAQAAGGRGGRLFLVSLTDVFEADKGLDGSRARLWMLIEETPDVTWLLLTEGPHNVMSMVPSGWLEARGGDTPAWPGNAWIGVTVQDQQRAELRIPAPVRFVLAEPLLEAVDLRKWMGRTSCPACGWEGNRRADSDWLCSSCEDAGRCPHQLVDPSPSINWIIVGGESGPHARPFDLAWARSLRDQCAAAGVPFFMRQMGARPRGVCAWRHHDKHPPEWLDEDGTFVKVSKRPAQDLCHSVDDAWWPCDPELRDRAGADPAEWPEDLRVQQFPEVQR